MEQTFSRIDPLAESPRWDKLVVEHPRASVFHTSAWIRVLCQTYGYRPLCFVTEGGRPAILPLIEVDSFLTGRRGISLPFTDSCSALTSLDGDFRGLWKQALRVGQERRWRTFEMRDYEEGCGLSPSLQFYTHSLTLAENASVTFDLFDSSVRRAIRKAERSGVDVTVERSESAMKVYYEMHCLTRKKHGLPPQSYRFFQNIHRWIIEPGLGFLVLARVMDKPIAGAVFFRFCRKAIYKFGASDPQAEPLRPNNLVMWRAITELCANGCKTLDFGRTSLQNAGLRRYKASWGAIERVSRYLKWDFAKGANVQDRDKADGLHTSFFRLLPGNLSRIVGRLLYPHIA